MKKSPSNLGAQQLENPPSWTRAFSPQHHRALTSIHHRHPRATTQSYEKHVYELDNTNTVAKMNAATIMDSNIVEAPPDPATPPPDGHCPWNKLPPELKDMVFDLAYVPAEKLRPLHKKTWEANETERQHIIKSRFVPGNFPEHFVDRLFISTEWCTAALKHVFGRAHFDFGSDATPYLLYPYPFELRPLAKQITAMTVKTTYDCFHRDFMECLPRLSLQRLTLEIDCMYFRISLKKDITANVWSEEDFDEFEPSRLMLPQLRGIPFIKIEPCYDLWSLGVDEDNGTWQTFEANLKVLENMAGKVSKMPRKTFAPKRESDISENNISENDRSGNDIAENDISENDTFSSAFNSLLPASETSTPLRDDEIPDDESGLQELVATRGAEFLAWVRKAKRKRTRWNPVEY